MGAHRSLQGMVGVAISMLVATSPLNAQSMVVTPSLGRVDIRTERPGRPADGLEGWLFGVRGEASLGALRVDGGFQSGDLDRVSGTGRFPVREGRVRLGAEVAPGFVLAAGPRISRVSTPAGGRTIVRWRLAADLSVPMILDHLTGYASLGGSLAGSDIDRLPHVGGGGGEIGLRWMPRGLPIRAILGYRLDREAFDPGVRQTFETTFLALGVAFPSVDRRSP